MRDLLLLAIRLLVTFAKLLRPGGVRALAAESLSLKQQLVISNRCRQRAPNLTTLDRFVLGLITQFVRPRRIPNLSVILRPATLFKFHKALVDRKYRLLFSSSFPRRQPGPKGPSTELIAAIIELKRHNSKFGCARIAQQISHAFGVDIDKDVVRRVLAKHYRPAPGADGPSWLSFIARHCQVGKTGPNIFHSRPREDRYTTTRARFAAHWEDLRDIVIPLWRCSSQHLPLNLTMPASLRTIWDQALTP